MTHLKSGRASLNLTDVKLLRRAFGSFATGVTVVTVGGDDPHAMTANAFTSVSLEPPLVLVCVDKDAVMHKTLLSTGVFGVSVLAAHQQDVAQHFADNSRVLGAEQFDAVDWVHGDRTGAPLMHDSLATFECALWRTYEGGDHDIFTGELLSLDWQEDLDALLFFNGKFRHLKPSTIPADGDVREVAS